MIEKTHIVSYIEQYILRTWQVVKKTVDDLTSFKLAIS